MSSFVFYFFTSWHEFSWLPYKLFCSNAESTSSSCMLLRTSKNLMAATKPPSIHLLISLPKLMFGKTRSIAFLVMKDQDFSQHLFLTLFFSDLCSPKVCGVYLPDLHLTHSQWGSVCRWRWTEGFSSCPSLASSHSWYLHALCHASVPPTLLTAHQKA